MEISKDQISMQLQKGTLWLAPTDIIMSAVIVLLWENPLISRKDDPARYEYQKPKPSCLKELT